MNDTAELLKECDAGIKMGVNSINDVIDSISDGEMKKILTVCIEEHQRLGSEAHALLEENGTDGGNPPAMARGMSWLKTEIMMTAGDDSTAAGLITDGCNMGIKSLCKYLNEYKGANQKSRDIAKRLISVEEKLACDMRNYL